MENCSSAPTGPIKAKGELGIEDLPPIEELTITVSENDCIKLGAVSGIVDTLGKLFHMDLLFFLIMYSVRS